MISAPDTRGTLLARTGTRETNSVTHPDQEELNDTFDSTMDDRAGNGRAPRASQREPGANAAASFGFTVCPAAVGVRRPRDSGSGRPRGAASAGAGHGAASSDPGA